MSAETILRVENLGKCYHIYNRPQDRLKQIIFNRWGRRYYREFWALRSISFEIKQGEMIGIIGKNGAGKSTLLQLISGTLTPTEGAVHLNGNLSALLELGTGFNPEFTGRENLVMNASILGLSKKEIRAREHEIIEFADIGEFIDQPVKTYSSGMYVRLAFAIQVCLEPSLLVVDEALAVGDVFFRQKCYQRLRQLREKGTSILLVSHTMNDIEQFCSRALLLNHGEALFLGSSGEAVKRYYLIDQACANHTEITSNSNISCVENAMSFPENRDSFHWPQQHAFLDISHLAQISNGAARCTALAICNTQNEPCRKFQQGETARFYCEFILNQDIEVPFGGLVIQNDKGLIIYGKHSLQYQRPLPCFVRKGSCLRFRHDVKMDLECNEYVLEVGLAALSKKDYACQDRFLQVELDHFSVRLCEIPKAAVFSVCPRSRQLLFYGLVHLLGDSELMVVEKQDEC